ncbi:MAG: ATP-binding cassette domain-containing protein [Verrucomicrobia bacterium]|nr:ATP-binding cassette domain-containing protein [Verrucomicrobiota bacterium]
MVARWGLRLRHGVGSLGVSSEQSPQSGSAGTPARSRFNSESFHQAAVLFGYLGPYRGRLAVAAGCLLVSTSLGLAFPFLTGKLLDAAMAGSRSGTPTAWASGIDGTALILVVCLATQAFFSFFSSMGFHQSGQRALADLRIDTFGRLIGFPIGFFGDRRVGELSSRLAADLSVIEETFTTTIPQFLRQTTLLVGGVILIAVTSWRLGGVMISTFPVLMLAAVLFGRRIRKRSRDAQDRLAAGGSVVHEALQGIATVKAFGNERLELDRYALQIYGFLDLVLKTAMYRASLVSFIIFGVFGSIVLVFWYGARLMESGSITYGDLTRFILYTTFVGGSVASFTEVYSQVQKTLGATERVREILAGGREVDATQPRRQGPRDRLSGAVEFQDVGFHYPSRPEIEVLRGLHLSVAPGEKVALVGPSGSGKSTLVSLLLRFYEPQKGRLLLDGRPAQDLELERLRDQFALVPQEVLLFAGTIEENIRYGRPTATVEEIREAARRALCSGFIEKLPEGYQTLVGERGIQLSGGQRQRLAIARALLKDPSILILDEATSALDAENEQLLQRALEELLQGRTAFIIAHRLSTIRKVDRIFVVEEGRVMESGNHDELMAHPDGRYRRLAEIQFGAH